MKLKKYPSDFGLQITYRVDIVKPIRSADVFICGVDDFVPQEYFDITDAYKFISEQEGNSKYIITPQISKK